MKYSEEEEEILTTPPPPPPSGQATGVTSPGSTSLVGGAGSPNQGSATTPGQGGTFISFV